MIKITSLLILVALINFSSLAMLPPGKVSRVRGNFFHGYSLKLNDTNTIYCMKEKHGKHIFAVLENEYGGGIVPQKAAHEYYKLLAQRYKEPKT